MPVDTTGVPGIRSAYDISPRNIFLNTRSGDVRWASHLASVNGSLSRDTGNVPTWLLRAGLLMGKITSTGALRNSIIGLTGAVGSADTTLTVSAAVATEIARLITLAAGNVSLKISGPPTAAGTIAHTAVTATAAAGTTITLSGAIGVAKAAGSLITPADGSEIMFTVLTDQGPLRVAHPTDLTQSIDQMLPSGILIAADFQASMIINLTECDASCQTYIKATMRSYGGTFTFDNDRRL